MAKVWLIAYMTHIRTRYKKRKNLYFKVTLMRHTKLFGDLPIITVTNNTVLERLCLAL